MAQGRCAGCGYSGSCVQVGTHILTCPDYLELFRNSPDKCLDPEAEYQRHKDEDNSETRAERRDQRLAQRHAEADRLHALEEARWRKPADIFED
jgi:hypothetical protein